MEVLKTIKELETDLKSKKKLFDKLQKRLKKCTSSFQYDSLYDEIEILNEDILELQLLIQEERRKKKKQKEMEELLNN